jgi:hypothetical protein
MAELHEQFTRAPEKVKLADNRKFGLVVGGIVLFIGGLRAYLQEDLSLFNITFVSIGAAMMIIGIVWPGRLAPLNYAWSKIGLMLHKFTNPLFLGAMYLIAIVPSGLIMRLFGADPMSRRMGPGESYWVKKSNQRSSRETLKKPY